MSPQRNKNFFCFRRKMIRSLELERNKKANNRDYIDPFTNISFLRLEYSVITIRTNKTVLVWSNIQCKGHRIIWQNRKRISTDVCCEGLWRKEDIFRPSSSTERVSISRAVPYTWKGCEVMEQYYGHSLRCPTFIHFVAFSLNVGTVLFVDHPNRIPRLNTKYFIYRFFYTLEVLTFV